LVLRSLARRGLRGWIFAIFYKVPIFMACYSFERKLFIINLLNMLLVIQFQDNFFQEALF